MTLLSALAGSKGYGACDNVNLNTAEGRWHTMAFCINCGNQLPDGARFCASCGTPVNSAPAQDPSEDEKSNENPVYTQVQVRQKRDNGTATDTSDTQGTAPFPDSGQTKTKPAAKNNKTALIVIGGIVIALLIILILWLALRKPSEKAPGSISAASQIGDLVSYTNSNVYFSLDYPADYKLTEPADNNVLITDSDSPDFQVSAEYAFHTAGSSAIYSAKDFVDQIEANGSVLTDWLGVPALNDLEGPEKTRLGGNSAYEYEFDFTLNGDNYTGKLLIADTNGKFGCYSFLCAWKEDSSKAEYFSDLADAMEDSFKITGEYEQRDYTYFHDDEMDMSFLLRKTAISDISTGNNHFSIYPVEDEYVNANIFITKTNQFSANTDPADILEDMAGAYFRKYTNTEYVSSVSPIQYGRYPCSEVDLECYRDGRRVNVSLFALQYGDSWLQVYMEARDDFKDTCAAAVSDFLFSVKIGNAPPAASSGAQMTQPTQSASSGGSIADVIRTIESRPNFKVDQYWEPMAAYGDYNGDGVWELLALYTVEDSGAYDVVFELWGFENGPELLEQETVITLVGGNSCTVGAITDGGHGYIAIELSYPTGSGFHDFYIYSPWDDDGFEDPTYYFEHHGNIDTGEMLYIIDDTEVSKDEFERHHSSFTTWVCWMTPYVDSLDAMTFSEIKNSY